MADKQETKTSKQKKRKSKAKRKRYTFPIIWFLFIIFFADRTTSPLSPDENLRTIPPPTPIIRDKTYIGSYASGDEILGDQLACEIMNVKG